MERNRAGSTVLTFLIGGIVGAGIALLYAPNSGTDTRRKLKEGLEDAGDWTRDKYNDAKYRVSETAGRVRQMAVDKKEDFHAAVEAGKEAYYKGKERLLRESS